MVKHVYIVTEGEYSDYRIIAVFSTLNKAKGYINRYNELFKGTYSEGRMKIETHLLNSVDDEWIKGEYAIYRVFFDEDGNVTHVYPLHDTVVHKEVTEFPARFSKGVVLVPYSLGVNVKVKNEEDAVKVAAEKRAMYLVKKDVTHE